MKSAMTTHADHKYSITIHSEDLAVVNCLRALSKYSQETGNNTIAYGNTTDKHWKKERHEVTFHFSDPKYRESFLIHADRLLPRSFWNEVRRSNNDPAKPAR